MQSLIKIPFRSFSLLFSFTVFFFYFQASAVTVHFSNPGGSGLVMYSPCGKLNLDRSCNKTYSPNDTFTVHNFYFYLVDSGNRCFKFQVNSDAKASDIINVSLTGGEHSHSDYNGPVTLKKTYNKTDDTDDPC